MACHDQSYAIPCSGYRILAAEEPPCFGDGAVPGIAGRRLADCDRFPESNHRKQVEVSGPGGKKKGCRRGTGLADRK